uniref:Uncharacterized protein n=1 Tax=Setaria digitata TaxID=48799 RepID=A0A915PV27_9BILA
MSTSVSSSDDCPVNSKIRRRIIPPTTIPRPIPTLIPPIPSVFPPLFNPFTFISSPTTPLSLNFPHSSPPPILNTHTLTPAITQPVPAVIAPLPAALNQRIRQLSSYQSHGQQSFGTTIASTTTTRMLKRKTTKIWKPYDIKS